ncbi:NAD(P)H-binding protein [Thalassotalea mangrovi]|nr:NAD(P)H-binding protein [Thalassotalea mangrovi]
MKTALVLGATGLTGSVLLQKLLQDDRYRQVICVARRPIDIDNKKLVFTELSEQQLQGIYQQYSIDDVFCCLGTTIKKAKSKDAFIKVDKDLVVMAGKHAANAGVNKFVVISALGARTNSFSFYNRIKGEMEAQLQNRGLQHLVIVRPSLILGPRQESRTGEDIAKRIYHLGSLLIDRLLPAYRPVEASKIAQMMINQANQSSPDSLTVVENKDIHNL